MRYHQKRPVYDNAVSRRSWLCWCDNWRQNCTEIHLYGPKFGLFGIALHLTSRAAILIVPNLTEQDCVVLHSTAVSCSGLDGTGLGWAVKDCTALHCTALDGLDSTAVDLYGPGLCWVEMYLAGREWKELDGKEQNWMAWGSTEQAQTPLDRLDRNKLDWSARQRSGMDWT